MTTWLTELVACLLTAVLYRYASKVTMNIFDNKSKNYRTLDTDHESVTQGVVSNIPNGSYSDALKFRFCCCFFSVNKASALDYAFRY